MLGNNVSRSGGRNCVGASDVSSVDIKVNDLTFQNCNNGVFTEDFASVRLKADPSTALDINADNNGINPTGGPEVRLFGIDIFVTGAANGIFASCDVEVVVDPLGDCIIKGGDLAVDESGAASVDTDDYELISGVVPTPTPVPHAYANSCAHFHTHAFNNNHSAACNSYPHSSTNTYSYSLTNSNSNSDTKPHSSNN